MDNYWAEVGEQTLVLSSKVMQVLEGRPLPMAGSALIAAVTSVLALSIDDNDDSDLDLGEAFLEVTLADIRASVTQLVVQQRKNAGIAPDPAGEARLKDVQEERERVRRRYMPVH